MTAATRSAAATCPAYFAPECMCVKDAMVAPAPAPQPPPREPCVGLGAIGAYSSLAACSAPLDAAVACGTTTLCGALDREAPGGREGGRAPLVDASRCVYRPEGERPAVACDAVDQWPEFSFEQLIPWDAEFERFGCAPGGDAARRSVFL